MGSPVRYIASYLGINIWMSKSLEKVSAFHSFPQYFPQQKTQFIEGCLQQSVKEDRCYTKENVNDRNQSSKNNLLRVFTI